MANVFRPYIKVTGGTSDALDGETQMIEGDTALVSTLDGIFYIYVCRNSAAAASAPSVVQPVNVTSDLRWHLAHVTTQGSEHWAASVGGTANAITLSFAPAFTSVPVGVPLYFRVGSANTGSVSIAVDSLTAITAKKSGTLDIGPGDFAVGSVICLIYDGTNFQVIGVSRYRSEYYVAGGTANALTVTCNPPLTALIPGMPIYFKASSTNTATGVTINIDGLGAKALTNNGATLSPGDILAGSLYVAIWDGATVQLINPTNAKIADAAVTNAKIADAAVTTAKIADAAVTTAKIAYAAITNALIADGTIWGNSKIAPASISGSVLVDGGIWGQSKLAAASVTWDRMSATEWPNANNYQRLPTGTIHQFGSATGTTNNDQVTFPFAFAAPPYVQVTSASGETAYPSVILAGSITTTGFKWARYTGNVGQVMHWHAFGKI